MKGHEFRPQFLRGTVDVQWTDAFALRLIDEHEFLFERCNASGLTDSESMQNYLVQKAQQALEAMCEEALLSNRLNAAKRHFEDAAQYLDTAPEDVRKYVKAFIDSDVEHDVRRSSVALQSAIESVFGEAGREDMTLGKSGDSTPWSN